MWTDRQTDRQTGGEIGIQAGRDRQTERRTDRCEYKKLHFEVKKAIYVVRSIRTSVFSCEIKMSCNFTSTSIAINYRNLPYRYQNT
jgi:hypothetical protein